MLVHRSTSTTRPTKPRLLPPELAELGGATALRRPSRVRSHPGPLKGQKLRKAVFIVEPLANVIYCDAPIPSAGVRRNFNKVGRNGILRPSHVDKRWK